MDTMTPNVAEDEGSANRSPRGRRKLIVRFTVMSVILALVFGGFYAFDQFRKSMIAKFFAGNVPPPATVSSALADAEPMPRFLEGIGTLAAVHQVTVAPEAGGRVTAVLFEAGATVKAGQPLVQLNDGPDRADLASYRAQERLALVTLERSQTLADKNFGTRQTVDQAQSQLDTARAGIARADAVIAQKLVRAPFAGQLGVRQIEVGQFLSAGTAVVTLTDPTLLYINFTLPEQARTSLKVGQTVEVRLDAVPGRVFQAGVNAIEPQVDAGTRSIKVQATMNNADGTALPGMFAAVRVVLPPVPNIVSVPETAIDYTAYGEAVYVVRPSDAGADGKAGLKAVQIFVKTGTHHDGRVSVLEGIAAGDRVVTAGLIKLHNGAPVVLSSDTALTKPAQPPVN